MFLNGNFRRAILVVLALTSGPSLAAAGWTNSGTIGEINQQGSTTPGSEMVFVKVSVTTNPSDPVACST